MFRSRDRMLRRHRLRRRTCPPQRLSLSAVSWTPTSCWFGSCTMIMTCTTISSLLFRPWAFWRSSWVTATHRPFALPTISKSSSSGSSSSSSSPTTILASSLFTDPTSVTTPASTTSTNKVEGTTSTVTTNQDNNSSSMSSLLSLSNQSDFMIRTLSVHIVHRHGDRTPITPLRDESYWTSTLISTSILDRIGSNTFLVQDENAAKNTHTAKGRGPFGQLTELGLLQMIQVGTRLREELVTDQEYDFVVSTTNPKQVVSDDGRKHPSLTIMEDVHVWNRHRPLHPSNLRVYCTDFARTIQSVQGLLVGLFPNVNNVDSATSSTTMIPIDIRHTITMIPDPQPRQTIEQTMLERVLAQKPHIVKREQELLPLAIRCTAALQPLLAPDAHDLGFGVPQERLSKNDDNEDESVEIQPLAWNQMAEITKCLAVRNLLPPGISANDQEMISRHAAWRWYQTLSHPRVAYLAMHPMVERQLHAFANYTQHPPVTIWSAHDSTLIGLMCAYRLEQPTEWPEYASVLQIELLHMIDLKKNNKTNQGAATTTTTSTITDLLSSKNVSPKMEELYVRFSLNGERLRSKWWDPPTPLDVVVPDHVIPLSALLQAMQDQLKKISPSTLQKDRYQA